MFRLFLLKPIIKVQEKLKLRVRLQILLVIANATFQSSYAFANYIQQSSVLAQRSNQQILPEQREENECYSEGMCPMVFNYNRGYARKTSKKV